MTTGATAIMEEQVVLPGEVALAPESAASASAQADPVDLFLSLDATLRTRLLAGFLALNDIAVDAGCAAEDAGSTDAAKVSACAVWIRGWPEETRRVFGEVVTDAVRAVAEGVPGARAPADGAQMVPGGGPVAVATSTSTPSPAAPTQPGQTAPSDASHFAPFEALARWWNGLTPNQQLALIALGAAGLGAASMLAYNAIREAQAARKQPPRPNPELLPLLLLASGGRL
jgi:hypothetical protein